jgi:hypothetical protein
VIVAVIVIAVVFFVWKQMRRNAMRAPDRP